MWGYVGRRGVNPSELLICSMFLGTTTLTLDAKGRIAIPARYRAQLKELCDGKLVVSYNPLDKCLPIYPYSEWLVCQRKMAEVKDRSEEFRAFQRFLFSATNEVDMDSNGRVLIPQASRELIEIETRENDDKKLIDGLKSRTERLDIGFSL